MLKSAKPGRAAPCLSELAFDRLHAGELGPSEEHLLAAHLATCAECRAKQRDLQEGDREFLAHSESRATLDRLRTRVSEPKQKRRFALRELAIAATLLLGCLLLLPRPSFDGTRTKGSLQFGYFVKRGNTVFRGGAGEHLYPGDQLRFTLRPPHAGFLAILALDQRGTASVYFPPSALVQQFIAHASDEVAVDGATELDDSLGAETMFALFCTTPRSLETLRRSLATRRTLSAQEDCQLDSLRVYKEPAPP